MAKMNFSTQRSRILTTLAVVGALSLAALPAIAQPRQPPPPARAAERLQELRQELGLDARQVAAIRGILEQAAAERRSARGHEGTRGNIREQIADVLTPAQRARFQLLKGERRLQHLTERLGLDARQVATIRGILQQTATQAEAVHAMPRGTPERREAGRALREQLRTRIAQILTPEQRATFVQLREERGEHGRRHGRGHGRGHGEQGGHRGGRGHAPAGDDA